MNDVYDLAVGAVAVCNEESVIGGGGLLESLHVSYIEEVGDSVETLQIGDWVVVPFAFDDGHYQYGPSIDAPLASETGMQGKFVHLGPPELLEMGEPHETSC